MAEHRLGIIMAGVTGRMGTKQHLVRSVLKFRHDGGVVLADGSRVIPDPILLGRDGAKLEALAAETGVSRWTTDLDVALANPDDQLFFDAGIPAGRAGLLQKAIAAGKHIYSEKPLALSVEDAMDLYRRARDAGIKHGVVQDKIYLTGLRKIKSLIDDGFFGDIFAVRGEFGYWVFEGDWRPGQRPSWNYRKEFGGGIIFDMLPHWRYVLDTFFGNVASVSCLGATHIPRRWDENGDAFEADAEDAAYATFRLDNGIIVSFNSAYCTRVRRDDTLTFQVDGTLGAAVAGFTRCVIQDRDATPFPSWNPDATETFDFRSAWREYEPDLPVINGFNAEWELFIKHLYEGTDFPWDLRAGVKGVQLAELATQSWRERRWIDIPELED